MNYFVFLPSQYCSSTVFFDRTNEKVHEITRRNVKYENDCMSLDKVTEN